MGSYTPTGLTFPTTYEIYGDNPDEFVNIVYGITNNPHETIFDGIAYLGANTLQRFKGNTNKHLILSFKTETSSPAFSISSNMIKLWGSAFGRVSSILYTDGSKVHYFNNSGSSYNEFEFEVNDTESIVYKHVYINVSNENEIQIFEFIDTDNSERPYSLEDNNTNLYIGYIEQPALSFGTTLTQAYSLTNSVNQYGDAVIKFGSNDDDSIRRYEIEKVYASSKPILQSKSINGFNSNEVGVYIKSKDSTTNNIYVVSNNTDPNAILSFYNELT